MLIVSYTGGGPTCTVAKTGDVNVSGDLTAADIIYMVAFVGLRSVA